MGLTLDIDDLSDAHTDLALELLCKAQGDDPLSDAIFDEHPSPFIRRLVEMFYERGLMRLDRFREELKHWLDGRRFVQSANYPRPALEGAWSPDELDLVRMYLRTLPPGSFVVEDYLLLVDFLCQRYLPASEMTAEADWLSTRSTLMGRVQAAAERALKPKQIDAVLAALPPTAAAVEAAFPMSAAQRQVLLYARLHAAENVQKFSAVARYRLRDTVLRVTEERLGVSRRTIASALQTQISDEFAVLNRDWRRIAVTEAGEAANQGYVASMPEGARIERVEQYRGACPFCRKINGKVMEVVPADKADKDGATQVWPGKTNVGRSASPRKRVGSQLIEREPHERWQVPAGTVHPHCFVSPNVPIYTDSGWKKISSIVEGDIVLAHTGKFRAVNWVLRDKRYTGEVVKIHISFRGRNKVNISEMTPDHPVLASSGWVNAGNLRPGEKLKALAQKCPTCGFYFVNAKHKTIHCSTRCAPKLGTNQFSVTGNQYAAAVAQTAAVNKRRMRGMTIEQRRELTGAARAIMAKRGYSHLHTATSRRKGSLSAAAKNYVPSQSEIEIAEMLDCLGFKVALQYRVNKTVPDIRGRPRYWWLDIALPEQKIAIEIDGEPWHGRLAPEGRDAERDKDLKLSGWNVLRFDVAQSIAEPHKIAESIARIAMNHNNEYVFAEVEVTGISTRLVKNRRLYNFGVDGDESYVIGRGVVVHNCRGTWVPTLKTQRGDDPQFAMWLAATLKGAA